MATSTSNWLLGLVNQSTLILFAFIIAYFGLTIPAFFTAQNLTNIVIQSSSLIIISIGMTFVLLTAGIDLSIGSIMFLAGVISGKMVVAGRPRWQAFLAILGMGLAYGLLNGLVITRFKVLPFIVTLATLYIGRGFGLFLCETRAVNLPDNFTQIGSSKLAMHLPESLGDITSTSFFVTNAPDTPGVPFPIVVMLLVLFVSHYILAWTPLGRRIYAVGNNIEKSEKAGLHSQRIILFIYVYAGLCAAIGGMVAIAQLGSISPTFGEEREFAAIAAAVLGGTSLFGGKGSIIPGTIIGALLIQTLENGLNIMNTDPYLYPLITSGIIFLVVLNDSLRNSLLKKLQRRNIRVEK